MSKRSDKDLLADIQEAVQRIKTYIQDLNYDAFLGDSKTQHAGFRNLEILGEAAKIFPMLSEKGILLSLGSLCRISRSFDPSLFRCQLGCCMAHYS